jgi:hypothetical protein
MLKGKQDFQVLSVGTNDGITFPDYRVTTMAADVLASGGHFLFDVTRDELGNLSCVNAAVDTYSYAGRSGGLDSLSGASLDNRGSMSGGGTGFVNFQREGALYSNAATSNCKGTDADVRAMPWL